MIKSKLHAFTLIELLVVISIIAILAGIALPVFGEVQIRGAQTNALSNAKQIGLACKLFAQDYGGRSPHYIDPDLKGQDAADSNSALQTLIPNYVPDKKIFSIPKSKYCANANAAGSVAGKLGAGENEWSLVIPLSDTSNARFPLIADGFLAGTHTYSTDETVPGGVWKGRKAIVIRCDISGSVEVAKVSGQTSFVKRDDNPAANLFDPDPGATPPWMTGTTVISPIP